MRLRWFKLLALIKRKPLVVYEISQVVKNKVSVSRLRLTGSKHAVRQNNRFCATLCTLNTALDGVRAREGKKVGDRKAPSLPITQPGVGPGAERDEGKKRVPSRRRGNRGKGSTERRKVLRRQSGKSFPEPRARQPRPTKGTKRDLKTAQKKDEPIFDTLEVRGLPEHHVHEWRDVLPGLKTCTCGSSRQLRVERRGPEFWRVGGKFTF